MSLIWLTWMCIGAASRRAITSPRKDRARVTVSGAQLKPAKPTRLVFFCPHETPSRRFFLFSRETQASADRRAVLPRRLVTAESHGAGSSDEAGRRALSAAYGSKRSCGNEGGILKMRNSPPQPAMPRPRRPARHHRARRGRPEGPGEGARRRRRRPETRVEGLPGRGLQKPGPIPARREPPGRATRSAQPRRQPMHFPPPNATTAVATSQEAPKG